MMAAVSVVIIPVIAVVQYRKRRALGLPTGLKAMFSPNEKWGPAVVAGKPREENDNDYINDGFKFTVETGNM